MDVSTFKAYKACEAKALAIKQGKWQEQRDQTPLLVGNYIHSYMEGQEAHKNFVDEHKKDIYRYGNPAKGLKNDYQLADRMIQTLGNDQAFQNIYMRGGKEIIVVGQIGDHDWKGKIDSLNLKDGYFCDLKTVDNIHKKHWDEDEHAYVPFIKSRGYYYQMAVYRELIRQTFGVDCQPFIFAVSKQSPYPDHAAFKFESIKDQDWLDEAMQDITGNQQHIFDVITGKVPAKRCEKCDYCRATKQITHFTNAAEIEVD